jgi:hypothetical protein
VDSRSVYKAQRVELTSEEGVIEFRDLDLVKICTSVLGERFRERCLEKEGIEPFQNVNSP